MLATSSISLLGLLTLSAGSIHLINRATQLRAGARLAEAEAAITTLLEKMKDDCRASVQRAGERADTRAVLAGLSASGTTPGVTTLAGDVRVSEGLDLLTIMDSEGTVLTRAHWPESFGMPDPSARLDCNQLAGLPIITSREVRDSTLVVLVSCSRCEAAGKEYYIEGGYRIGEAFALELKILLGMEVSVLAPGKSHRASRSSEAMVQRQTSGRHSSIFAIQDAGEEDAACILALAVATISLAASLVFALLSAKRITMGLENLAAATEDLADGGTILPIPGRADYEVRKLSESFSRMSEELEDSRRRLQLMERVSAWRDLARVLAHEIRNALSPIRLSVESIRTSVDRGGAEAADVVEKCGRTIEAEVKSLEVMVGEFASFARLPDPSPSPHRINDIVRESIALFSGMMDNVRLHEDCGPETLLADVDKDQAKRAIGNIVLNAIESMPEGGTLGVQTAARLIGAKPYVVVRISDSGSGIRDEDKEKIFTPYFTTKENGTGLGLSVAQSILISHGGSIELDETRDGEGAAFTLRFPFSPSVGESSRESV
jgi:signal transduction histidine kinase